MVVHTDAANAGAVRISMFAPNRDRCGISDYSRNLIAALSDLSSVDVVRRLEPPDSAASESHLAVVANRHSRAEQFRQIGTALSSPPVHLTHVQHEYSLLGGVAPHRNQAAALYSSVTVPMVITVHEIVSEIGSSVRRAAIRHINRVNFIHPVIRAWIVHTEADRERLAGIGANPMATHVVPMGVPTVDLRVERGEARTRLGMTDKRVVALFGFLSAKKGHGDAIEAISKMPEDVALVLAGGQHPDDRSDYSSILKSEIEVRNRITPGRVQITGFLRQDELQYLLAATDVAVAPYHYSSGSASVAHLLAAGVPVIASDIPAFQEIETEMPGTLALVPPRKPDLLAEELLRVLNDPLQLQSLRRGAVRYAAAHTYGAMAEETVKVYMAALGMIP